MDDEHTRLPENASVKNPRRASRLRLLRFGALVVLLACGAALYQWFDIGSYFSHENLRQSIEQVRAAEERMGLLGPVAFCLGGIVAIVLNIPTIVVITFAAVIYGMAGAAAMGFVALIVATFVIWWVSQYLGREFLKSHFGRYIPMVEAHFEKNGLKTVTYARLIFFALPPVNWVLASMNVGIKDFLVGTALGSTPHILVWSWLGGTIVQMLSRNEEISWISPELLAPMFLGVALTIAARILDRISAHREKTRAGTD
ncbi:MAG: VTT domain-containing protein [Pseudomonadota bacterium]|nr:VTT domain-containing protein [Pseudomonadota bacterium]